MHVSRRAIKPNEPAYNSLPFPRTRICMHVTNEPDELNAPSALAYSMHSMQHEQQQQHSNSSGSTATATATVAARPATVGDRRCRAERRRTALGVCVPACACRYALVKFGKIGKLEDCRRFRKA